MLTRPEENVLKDLFSSVNVSKRVAHIENIALIDINCEMLGYHLERRTAPSF